MVTIEWTSKVMSIEITLKIFNNYLERLHTLRANLRLNAIFKNRYIFQYNYSLLKHALIKHSEHEVIRLISNTL